MNFFNNILAIFLKVMRKVGKIKLHDVKSSEIKVLNVKVKSSYIQCEIRRNKGI